MKKLNVQYVRTLPNELPAVQSTTPSNFKIMANTDFKFNKSVFICGVVRNEASSFETVSKNVKKLAGWFKTAIIIIVESDSDDKTLELWSKDSQINLISLGNLRQRFPNKSERIAFCRNKYLETVLARKKEIDLMIAVDLNDTLSEELDDFLFEECLLETEYPKWDAVFSNQSYRYHDIGSLRDENVNFDFTEVMHKENKPKYEVIGKYQHHIPRNSGFLPVKSAFGGLGLYKASSLDQNCRYLGRINNSNKEISEHVPFNLYLTGKGCKLFIDSSMVLMTPPSFSKYYV